MMNRIGKKLMTMALVTMFATSVHCAEKALDELPLCYLSTDEKHFPKDGTEIKDEANFSIPKGETGTMLLKDSLSAAEFVRKNYDNYRFVLNFSSTNSWLPRAVALVAEWAKDHLIELYYPENSSVTEFDVTPFTALKKLSIRNNPALVTLKGLSKCTKLEELNVESTRLTELDVSKLSNLKRLFVKKCPIKALKDISKCTKLEELNAVESNIAILELDGCTSLTKLTVDGCEKLAKIKASKTKAMAFSVTGCTILTKMDAKAFKKVVETPTGCFVSAE